MLSADERRRRAVDCKRLATNAQAPGRRKELLEVAEQWLRLAERTEQLGFIADASRRMRGRKI
jgi:hypothetical protein